MVPTTTSAPKLPGDSKRVKLKISAATAIFILLWLQFFMNEELSTIVPSAHGYWMNAPKNSSELKLNLFSSSNISSIPSGADLVLNKDSV